jgi:hypothetical protein
MLGNDYFYFALIRKYTALFGSLFNNLIIQRSNYESGELTQIINVPLAYAEKDTMITRMKEDPSIEKPTSLILPRISFFLDGYTFDAERHSSSNGKYFITNKPNLTWQYKEIPWNFHFRVWLYVKNDSDASKMLEQILPFFTPAYTAKALLVPNRPPVDIPVILRSVTHLDEQNTDFKQRTMLIWELAYTLKGFLYSPVQTNKPIKIFNLEIFESNEFPGGNTIINTNFGISDNITEGVSNGISTLDFSETILPGLTEDGEPTTVLADSIPVEDINYDDPYGLIKIINPVSTN